MSNSKMPAAPSHRLLAIDYAKGIAILCMIGLHYLYVLANAQLISHEIVYSLPYLFFSRLVAIAFIALSTVVLWHRAHTIKSSRRWVRSIAKQVLKLTLAALLVSLATQYWLGETYVRFGILHLLAVMTLVNGILFRLHLPRWWYGFFSVLMLALGNWLLLYTFPITNWEWLGLMPVGFASVDYTPILPWLGVCWLTVPFIPALLTASGRLQPQLSLDRHWRWLGWCGRHSLALYLIHVPLLLSGLWLLQRFL